MAKKRKKTMKRQIKQLDWKFIVLAVGIILLGISILALNQKLTYKSSARLDPGAGNVAPNTDPIDDSNDKFPNDRDDNGDRDDNDDNGGNGDKDNINNNTGNNDGEGTKVWKKDNVAITTYADGSQKYCDSTGCNYTDADGDQLGNYTPEGGWTGQTPPNTPNTQLNDGGKPGEPKKSYTTFEAFMLQLKSKNWSIMKEKGYDWKWGQGWVKDPNYEPPKKPQEDHWDIFRNRDK